VINIGVSIGKEMAVRKIVEISVFTERFIALGKLKMVMVVWF